MFILNEITVTWNIYCLHADCKEIIFSLLWPFYIVDQVKSSTVLVFNDLYTFNSSIVKTLKNENLY